MNIYDKANELAAALKEQDDVKQYLELKNKLLEDDTNKAILKKYKKLQFEAQTLIMSGGKLSEEKEQEIQKLGEVLQFNNEISAFLQREYMVNRLLGDIYKTIGEAVDIDMSFMED